MRQELFRKEVYPAEYKGKVLSYTDKLESSMSNVQG